MSIPPSCPCHIRSPFCHWRGIRCRCFAAAQVPNVSRQEYTLMDISEDGFVSLMDDKGAEKGDLKMPSGTDEADKLAENIQKEFDDGKELTLTVIKVCCPAAAAHHAAAIVDLCYLCSIWHHCVATHNSLQKMCHAHEVECGVQAMGDEAISAMKINT